MPSRDLPLQDFPHQNWVGSAFGLFLNQPHQLVQNFLVSISDGLNLQRNTANIKSVQYADSMREKKGVGVACEPSPHLGASLPPSGRCCAAVPRH